MTSHAAGPNWPRPEYEPDHEPHFIFIITPPYSGSTALCKLFNTSHRSMLLQPRGEGQWLIPGLCGDDRWNPALEVDYESVRAVWLSRFQRIARLTQTTDVVIEKSPANMMRMEALSAQFRSCSFIANNRNPYANCASILYRQFPVAHMTADTRQATLRKLAKDWLIRSERIAQLLREQSIPLVTYESFCASPEAAISALSAPPGITTSMNPEAEVQVKEYQPQKISNHNDRQIGQLEDRDLAAINSILESEEALLVFFGYQLLRA